MGKIKVRGVEHYYEWVKEDSTSSSKSVMVFVHGWAGSDRYWESTARAIGDKFDCLLYDMRGFGRSRLPEQPVEIGYEMEAYAEDLAALLDALQLEKVYINAHSMGASVAVLFMNRYPELVEKAILTCSGIFAYDEKSFTAFHRFGGYVVKFRPKWLTQIPLMDKMFMARFLYRAIPSAQSRAFLEDFLLADYEAALGTIYTSVSKDAAEFMPEEFSKLSVPCLLVAGEYDKIIPAEMGKKAAELNDLVEFAMIPNTAHFPMLESADTYLQRVLEFL
ncbi:MAG: alpha/beta hydrolase [Hormoscilla sp. GM7CHS1pb]|nr:alpha/beta hydrolase [Hormoscilla sp. GM7CHS1pb]